MRLSQIFFQLDVFHRYLLYRQKDGSSTCDPIDSDAPIRELHNAVSERLNAALKYLNLLACTNLPDYAKNDINTATNIAVILLRDVGDVLPVIEQRGFDTSKS